MDMTHEDLTSVGVTAFGHRHKLMKKIKELAQGGGAGIMFYLSRHATHLFEYTISATNMYLLSF